MKAKTLKSMAVELGPTKTETKQPLFNGKRFITFRTSKEVKAARLLNCRNYDLKATKGEGIKAGQIIKGKWGYCIAEADVPGITGEVVSFKANGKAEWQNEIFPAMFIPAKKNGAENYIVIKQGTTLRTVEVDRFNGQPKNRLADLVR